MEVEGVVAVVGEQVRVDDREPLEGVREARDQDEGQRGVTFEELGETDELGGGDEKGEGEYEEEEGAVEELGEVEDGLVGGAVADDDSSVDEEKGDEEEEGGEVGRKEFQYFEDVAHHQHVPDERACQ